jgi:putative transposase
MCLRFVFLLITQVFRWLRLSRREDAWKTAEILILRHQVAILQRHQALRPKLTWADRALLATLLGVIPRARRQWLRLLVTPDTIMRWHRDIVRRRWAARSRRGRSGRPATRRNIKALVLRLARENPEWGYRRIHGELAGLGVKVAASTVGEILKTNGIGPSRRGTRPTWSQFLRSQAEAILACDFFTVGLLDGTQAYVLAIIEHATRRIRILGVTLHPTGAWTAQQARNLIMDLGEQAHRVKFVIRDRGSDFAATFDTVLADAEVRTVLCNVRTPRMNAIAERWIAGCRRELLDRTLVTPGGVIPEHIHPRQQEQFTILAGQAHITLNGQEHVAKAGETVVIPAGIPHSVANPGPAQIDGIVERRPARQAKEFHEAVAGLAADGKTTPTGAPKNPLQLGATFWHFRHESRVTSPPIWVQNLMLPPLWVLAKVFGVRPYYHHWDSRI